MPEDVKTFMIEDARVILRNFGGKEGPYNRQGERSFGVILPEDIAKQLTIDGWNVRYLKAREEGDEPQPFLPVAIRFDIYPPRIVMLTSTTRTQLDENSIEVLDWSEFKIVDLIVRGHDWNVNGKTGTKAYLQSLFVTIQENALELKYAIREE